MQKIKVSELISHPLNEYFFDDMVGQKWVEFLESVKTSGVIEPIVVTVVNGEKIVVSGHQRVRACIELGIEEIMVEVRIYDNEEKIIKDLIETNIRQRGDVSSSSLKMGRIIGKLEEIYGVRQGSANKKGAKVSEQCTVTQSNVAEQLGIDERSYASYKKLTTLIPEIQDLVDDKVSFSVASRIIAKLSQEEQEQLLVSLDATEKLTQKKVQEYINELKEENEDYINEIEESKKLELQIKESEIKNIKLELENAVDKISDLEDKKYDLVEQLQEYKEQSQEYKNLQTQIDNLTKEKDSISRQIGSALTLSTLVVDIERMLKNQLAPIKYSRALLDTSDSPVVVKNVTDILNCVETWCDEMRRYVVNKNDFINIESEEI